MYDYRTEAKLTIDPPVLPQSFNYLTPIVPAFLEFFFGVKEKLRYYWTRRSDIHLFGIPHRRTRPSKNFYYRRAASYLKNWIRKNKKMTKDGLIFDYNKMLIKIKKKIYIYKTTKNSILNQSMYSLIFNILPSRSKFGFNLLRKQFFQTENNFDKKKSLVTSFSWI